MTERAEKARVTLILAPEEFGMLLGCLALAVERSTVPDQRVSYIELSDKLRDAQREMLGPMSVAEGMSIVNEIQEMEKTTVVQLRQA